MVKKRKKEEAFDPECWKVLKEEELTVSLVSFQTSLEQVQKSLQTTLSDATSLSSEGLRSIDLDQPDLLTTRELATIEKYRVHMQDMSDLLKCFLADDSEQFKKTKVPLLAMEENIPCKCFAQLMSMTEMTEMMHTSLLTVKTLDESAVVLNTIAEQKKFAGYLKAQAIKCRSKYVSSKNAYVTAHKASAKVRANKIKAEMKANEKAANAKQPKQGKKEKMVKSSKATACC